MTDKDKPKVDEFGLYLAMRREQNKQLPFAGLIIDKKAYKFDVYLINPFDKHYKRVVIFSGAHASQDNGELLQTSRYVKELGELKPHNSILLDSSDLGELDFVIWYYLDLYPTNTAEEYVDVDFEILKYPWDYEKKLTLLPIINSQGMRINLERRKNWRPIEEIAKKDKEEHSNLYH